MFLRFPQPPSQSFLKNKGYSGYRFEGFDCELYGRASALQKESSSSTMFALLASLAEKRLSRLQVPELQHCKLTLPD